MKARSASNSRDPDTIWILPLNDDTAVRFPPDAAALVWRSRDVGDIWQEIARHLPTILTVEMFEHA